MRYIAVRKSKSHFYMPMLCTDQAIPFFHLNSTLHTQKFGINASSPNLYIPNSSKSTLKNRLTLVCQYNNFGSSSPNLNSRTPNSKADRHYQYYIKTNHNSPAVWIVLNILLSLLSFFAFPLVFGLPAIYLGYKVKSSQKNLGIGLILLAGICMLLGMIC